MLLSLRLYNIALIDSLELSLKKGFSVFTGETGAGKSIFLSAIDSLLGRGFSSSSSRLIRVGAQEASIEGVFTLDSEVKNWLNENSFDFDDHDELVISREWKFKDDRLMSRIRFNGQIANRKQLLALRPLLVDLVEQGQSHHLYSSGHQLSLIDNFGTDEIDKLLTKVKQKWDKWYSSHIALQIAQKEFDNSEDEFIAIQSFLDDINSANLDDPQEDLILTKEQDRLVHGVRIYESLLSLFNRLKENSDNFPSALDHFYYCINELKIISKLDSSLTSHLDNLFELSNGLDQFLKTLESYQMVLESDPNKLDDVQNRLSLLNRLKKRYDLDLPGIINRRDSYLKELSSGNTLKCSLKDLEQQEIAFRLERDEINSSLTKLRMKCAKKLEDNLILYLQPLGLENIQFKVSFASSIPSSLGADSVEFLFSANEGQPLASLSDIASGGELSRFLLALTSVLAEVSGSKTLIFDEIDSGVSGRVSTAIAKALKNLSRYKQVFCITHQPLVAALADHHFSVSKTVENGMTNSKVLLLQGFQERKSEIAKLAGGDFEQASIFAASLLDNKAA
ncbi:DNA repair protein RecN [Prochlorococcus marinus]|uniref:DNA repair protein RecN n=1 Tax=Prochlorococcus marinus TaxID=1219 RepID=UPI0022B5C24C|nr:DNA repair protein RecN [Prochlorococcus marinus]